jgi:hypothetical protein
VVLVRNRRAQQEYEPDELRERLHRRLAEAERAGGGPPTSDAPPGPEPRLRRANDRLRANQLQQ